MNSEFGCFIVIVVILGIVYSFFMGRETGLDSRRRTDRAIECQEYYRGKYLEGECWKTDTVIKLRLK